MSITITASELHAAFTADLDNLARKSAEELIAQGWTAEPDAYDIDAFRGDLEAAESYVGRDLTCAEINEHEARIRSHLARLTSARHFAALGTDGRRPVAWGIGHTESAAREDAAESLRDAGSYDDSADLRIIEIDAERYARIEGGEVDASDLWARAS